MYLEDYTIGQRYEIPPAVVDPEEMIAFARAYDPRPFHLDEEAAEATRFGELFASGFFTLSFAWSRWVKTGIDSPGLICGIGIERLRWLKPVYAGDALRSVLSVTGVEPAEGKDVGTVYAHYETTNQKNEVVLAMDVQYLVRKRPSATE